MCFSGHKLASQQNTDFNLNDLHSASSNMEVNVGETNNETGMDSDDLVPSIQVGGSSLLANLS